MPNITIIHPDLGIGGAERLIIDVALVLQSRGHKVTIYTSHHDPAHCFDETRDGQLDVRVRGNTLFPPHVLGRGHVLMAVLRQLHLVFAVLGELAAASAGRVSAGDNDNDSDSDSDGDDEGEGKPEEVFIVDQLAACVPVLKTLGEGYSSSRQRILFYCHFPDQLLARRDEGSGLLRLAKVVYRVPFDWLEGWAVRAADGVVANSTFTRRVVREVLGDMGDVNVVYPAVDVGPASGPEGSGDGNREAEAIWDRKIVLSVNRFERKKGIDLAIRAYHGLGGERTGRRLVIAGGYDNRIRENVEYHTELNTLATSLGLQTATANDVPSALSTAGDVDVLFLPSVNSTFRDTLLSQASLLLYTPINEHFGIVPVEAMRAGIPVLASNTGGPLETVVEGETGWLRDANDVSAWTDVIHTVLYQMSPSDLACMAAACRDRVLSEFSLTAMGERLEQEINSMLSSPRRPFEGARTVVFSLLSVVFLVVAYIVLFVF